MQGLAEVRTVEYAFHNYRLHAHAFAAWTRAMTQYTPQQSHHGIRGKVSLLVCITHAQLAGNLKGQDGAALA